MRKNAFTPAPIYGNVWKTKLVWGFTLIELLFVVIIIGILATILYPRFENFRIRARLKEVENTVQLIRAVEKYYYFKSMTWHLWDSAAAANDYVDAGTGVSAETVLHIDIPSSDDAMCLYYVEDDGSQVKIVFENKTSGVLEGHYVLQDNSVPGNEDTYEIDDYSGDWKIYLRHLE